MHSEKRLNGDVEHRIDHTVARGERNRESADREVYRAQLDGDGNLTMTVEETLEGEDALWQRRNARLRTPKGWKRAAERLAASISSSARIRSHTPIQCDKVKGTCQRTTELEIPGYAARKGDDELIVPLTAIQLWTANWFARAERHNDIEITRRELTENTLELVIPDGYEVVSVPTSATSNSASFAFTFTSRVNGRTVQIRRKLETRPGRHPKSRP